MEVQERIKKVDAAFTWPHPVDKGYFVSAVFVRTTEDKPYLIYCPKATCAISIDEDYLLWDSELLDYREVKLNQTLSKTGNVLFYIISLGNNETKVKKADIEKMFGVKVVD